MNEQYHSPNQPEQVDLRNAELQLDMHKDLYPSEQLGIPAENDQYSFSVAAEIVLPDHEKSGVSIAFVKAFNKQFDRIELFAVGIATDEDGNKKTAGQTWQAIKPGQKYNLGRKAPSEVEESEHRITGERLFGQEFPTTVSRSHLDIELTTEGGLTIEDHSTNGTKVAGHELVETPALIKEVPGIRGKLSAVRETELITHVPTAEEREQERSAAEQAEREEIQRKAAEILDKINELTANLSEDDKMALWKYASGTLNQREAQQNGRDQESINQGMVAGEGWKSMSKSARDVAQEYLNLMNQNSRLF